MQFIYKTVALSTKSIKTKDKQHNMTIHYINTCAFSACFLKTMQIKRYMS